MTLTHFLLALIALAGWVTVALLCIWLCLGAQEQERKR